MRRERATQLLMSLLQSLHDQQGDPIVDLVVRVEVFGSYSRGASEPSDVDINIDYDSDTALEKFGIFGLLSGKATSAIKRSLIGARRSINILFERQLDAAIPGAHPILLWEKGNDLTTALNRLRAITEDPAAGPAPRTHMHQAFQGLDKWLPVFFRQRMISCVKAGAVTVTQIHIDDTRVRDEDIALYIDERWKPGGAPNRAAHALLSVSAHEIPHFEPGL